MALKARIAELERQLAAARAQCEQLSLELARAQRDREEAETRVEQVRTNLRPVLAYFGDGWVGDTIRTAWRALGEFAKENDRG